MADKKICVIQYNKYNLQDRDKFPKIFFKKLLIKKLKENGFEVILLNTDYPKQINDIIEGGNKINLLLNFEDYYIRFSRHFHSNLNMKNVYHFYQLLEQSGTIIYPPPAFHLYTNSKMYAIELYKHSEFVLPYSNQFLLKASVDNERPGDNKGGNKGDNKGDNKEDNKGGNKGDNKGGNKGDNKGAWCSIKKHLKELRNISAYSIIKVGYSADMADIYFIDNMWNNSVNININPKMIVQLKDVDSLKKIYDEYLEHDKMDLIIIVQPYNEIVADRHKEYRLWYVDDKFIGHFCFGIIKNKEGKIIELLDNQKYDSNNEIHYNILHLANKLYKFILNEIRTYLKNPSFKLIALRLDMSYAVNSQLQDESSVILSDNKKYRFYCNELENIDGTYYLNLPVYNNKTHKKEGSSLFQYNLINTITKNLVV
jgi:hypothetical protein